MKNVEGIPEGWELVRIGVVSVGEWFVDGLGKPSICCETTIGGCAIIKQIEPPKPTYIPWTLETCPVGAVCVSLSNQRGIITLAGDKYCILGGADMRWCYRELLESGITCNGKPCGTEVNPCE